MKKKKNEENHLAKSLEESLEALFGREEDLTDAELDEELRSQYVAKQGNRSIEDYDIVELEYN